ncbi:hypothetical protein GGS20DRAFT_593527 [Poronia punctata]|nr:hypothetical protein GGS20DRAFT_593527 [Poronia punctata]
MDDRFGQLLGNLDTTDMKGLVAAEQQNQSETLPPTTAASQSETTGHVLYREMNDDTALTIASGIFHGDYRPDSHSDVPTDSDSNTDEDLEALGIDDADINQILSTVAALFIPRAPPNTRRGSAVVITTGVGHGSGCATGGLQGLGMLEEILSSLPSEGYEIISDDRDMIVDDYDGDDEFAEDEGDDQSFYSEEESDARLDGFIGPLMPNLDAVNARLQALL